MDPLRGIVSAKGRTVNTRAEIGWTSFLADSVEFCLLYAVIRIWEIYLQRFLEMDKHKKAAKKSFDSKSKYKEYEWAYKREYMFWYNLIKKLEKNYAT